MTSPQSPYGKSLYEMGGCVYVLVPRALKLDLILESDLLSATASSARVVTSLEHEIKKQASFQLHSRVSQGLP